MIDIDTLNEKINKMANCVFGDKKTKETARVVLWQMVQSCCAECYNNKNFYNEIKNMQELYNKQLQDK